ncbi:WD40 repeat-like protein [Lepidopterella palustris CBS 459.81]|uniref:WD40 repeat-like protein n=1 Tax=Lepidopterella palustris CBS 459.81 TaxID=1314670 RepID=A0A8E2EHD5_9PEZI|nr:WD40 repeat-like protein [Lepidopterella palustris CBS 459.81]
MVKSYSKYEHSQTFGVVASAFSNVVWTSDGLSSQGSGRPSGAGHAYVGANEEVLCWDVKKGELLSRWRDANCIDEVTAISRSGADKDVFAVGYGDGSIRIWDARTATIIITFNGHKSAVTTLAFDASGVRLASGAKDTNIIIWDLVAEVGLFKLRGHKGQITGLHFIQPKIDTNNEGDDAFPVETDADQVFLLSTAKDALIKIWDVAAQHCIETHVAQANGECWALGVSPDGSGCITAGNDGELKVWSLDLEGLRRSASQIGESTENCSLRERGVLYRQGKDRTLSISFHDRADYIAVHGSEKAIEIWRVRTEGEIQKSLARKRKRRREKTAAANADLDMDLDEQMNDDDKKTELANAEIGEVIVPYVSVRTGGKIRSSTWMDVRGHKKLQLLATTSNNLIEAYDISYKGKGKTSKSDEPPEYTRAYSVDLAGHRTDVRALALSSDDRMLASASSGSLKIWNVRTQSCLRTLDCGYALCCSFLPGDKIVIIGTKEGELELFDIASSTLIDRLQAHEGSIWTLNVHPDGRSVVSGSADRSVKFWNFEIVQQEIPGTKRTAPRLRLVQSRVLKVSEDILNLCFSPDSRLLAVSTLDNTVKVFFVDSLKLFLNLYGHSLPVLNMSISSDSKLMATCSADKTIRLWGLDFGDCHKALSGHKENIMQVSFIPHPMSKDEGHFFFSASKDRTVMSWDGDKFEQIQKLKGHHDEIWAMVVSRTGEFVVTASHDKSVRVWSQTDEPIFLEEERERELEELYESTLAKSLGNDVDQAEGENEEVAAASKQTISTLTAGERIAEALELGIADLELIRAWEVQKAAKPNMAPPQRDPLFMALGNVSAERHVLNTLSKIPAAQLHDALLVLPFAILPVLFTFIAIWVRRQWNTALVCRVLFFMLKTHQKQIVASREMKGLLEDVRADLRQSLVGMKDVLGFNLAALGFICDRIEEAGIARLEDVEAEEAKGKRKRVFVDIS